MFTRLRTRLLISSIFTILIVVGLIAFVLLERMRLNTDIGRLTQLRHMTRQVRGLNIVMEQNASDIADYMLGYHESRQKFAEHATVFGTILSDLLQEKHKAHLGAEAYSQIGEINRLRAEYDQAARQLFIAIDAHRAEPSAESQAMVENLRGTTRQLTDEIRDVAQAVDLSIAADTRGIEFDIEQRNSRLMTSATILGTAIIVLICVIQLMVVRAVGAPIHALYLGVKRFTAGDMSTRVPVKRRDEVGELIHAFNDMAATIQEQTRNLVQLDVAVQAREEAEAARAELEKQLAVIEDQLATIEQQRAVIREMSVPVLPLSKTTLLMPLIGLLDAERLHLVKHQALRMIERVSARYLILDVTGVPVIDTQIAQGLVDLFKAARLLGTEVVLVGIRPETAQAVVGLGINLGNIVTHSTLQSGVGYALQWNQERNGASS